VHDFCSCVRFFGQLVLGVETLRSSVGEVGVSWFVWGRLVVGELGSKSEQLSEGGRGFANHFAYTIGAIPGVGQQDVGVSFIGRVSVKRVRCEGDTGFQTPGGM
jgi:hypothetical protein